MREQQLQDQYDELVQKTIKDEEYLHVVRQLAKTDTKTIEDLKTEIQKAWKMADNAHAREQTAQELIENLRKQIDSLNAEIEFKNKMGQDTEEWMSQRWVIKGTLQFSISGLSRASTQTRSRGKGTSSCRKLQK